MQRRCCDVCVRFVLMFLLIILPVNVVFPNTQPDVDKRYREFFVHYVDKRSLLDKILNSIGLTKRDVGRSFALITGVSYYPNLSLNKNLNPAKEDLTKLQSYLKESEFFDEIVVLHNEEMNDENLKFFLQSYFPTRLRGFPKSRFLFAYSGHGFYEGENGYLLEYNARSLTDKVKSIKLAILKELVDEVAQTSSDSGNYILVLLNACYGGAFLKRPFGDDKSLLPKHGGAHAITAGGTREKAWHDPKVGLGSVFFEKLFAGLDGRADIYPEGGDGLITVDELFAYLSGEVKISTDQRQNPQMGDISKHGSRGGFFFLNRRRQIDRTPLSDWDEEKVEPMGDSTDSDESKDISRIVHILRGETYGDKPISKYPQNLDEALIYINVNDIDIEGQHRIWANLLRTIDSRKTDPPNAERSTILSNFRLTHVLLYGEPPTIKVEIDVISEHVKKIEELALELPGQLDQPSSIWKTTKPVPGTFLVTNFIVRSREIDLGEIIFPYSLRDANTLRFLYDRIKPLLFQLVSEDMFYKREYNKVVWGLLEAHKSITDKDYQKIFNSLVEQDLQHSKDILYHLRPDTRILSPFRSPEVDGLVTSTSSWFYKFWYDRYLEGTMDAAYEILLDTQEHYGNH